MTEDFTRVSGHAAVLRRRGWIVVLAALVGALLGAAAAPLTTTAYSAESVVLVPTPADPTDDTVVDTQVEVVTSDAVAQDVVDDLGGTADARDLLDSLTVEVVTDTTAISITSTQGDPDAAAETANAFATAYVTFSDDAVAERRREVVAELEEQLEEVAGRLVALRQELTGLEGVEQVETRAAIARQQQRQTRLVELLAETQDPTTAPRSAEVLQEAVAPSGDGAGRLRTAFFGLVLGLLVGLGIAYARHHADDRIHDEDDLMAVVGRTPVLGRIPRASTGPRGGGVLGDPGSKTAEAFRGLAVNLRLRVEHPRTPGAARGTGPPPPGTRAPA